MLDFKNSLLAAVILASGGSAMADETAQINVVGAVTGFLGGLVDKTKDKEADASGTPSTAQSLTDGKAKAEKVWSEVQDIPPRTLGALPTALDRTSFGKMHKNMDFLMYDCTVVLTPKGQRCSIGEMLTQTYNLQNLSLNIVHTIMPDALMTYDPELDRLKLRQYFKLVGAEKQDGPNVSVINSTKSQIDFLMRFPAGTINEADEAATAYCADMGKTSKFVGIAEACIQPTAGQVKAGQIASKFIKGPQIQPWRTYSIVSFNCETEKKASKGYH